MGEEFESREISRAATTSDTTMKTLITRTNDLLDNITRDFALLKEFEDELRVEDDPGRRAKYQRRIEMLKTSAYGYEQELRELERRLLTGAPEATSNSTARLEGVHEKLDALLAGQSDLHQCLHHLFQAMLRRYDAGEQRMISILIERMTYAQVQTLDVMLEAVERNQFDVGEMNEILSFVRHYLTERQERAIALPGGDDVAEVISAPQLDVKHKLKFAIPIIPLLLEYEGEIELGSGMNLEGLWNQLVDKVRRK